MCAPGTGSPRQQCQQVGNFIKNESETDGAVLTVLKTTADYTLVSEPMKLLMPNVVI